HNCRSESAERLTSGSQKVDERTVRTNRGEVTVRARSTFLVGVFLGAFPFIMVGAPVGSGVVRAAWALSWLAATCLVFMAGRRMRVTGNCEGVVVHKLGRDYRVRWDEVASIEVARSDNITGAVTTIAIRRTDGSRLIGRGASSYSRRAVERWRDHLVAARPLP